MLNERDRIKQIAQMILQSNTDDFDVLDLLIRAEAKMKRSKKELYRDNIEMFLDVERCRASNAELMIVNEQTNERVDQVNRLISGVSSVNGMLDRGCTINRGEGMTWLLDANKKALFNGRDLNELLEIAGSKKNKNRH